MKTVSVLKLTEEGAAVVMQAALNKARSMAIRANVAVVDDAGYLLAFVRMDGARLYTIPICIAKAKSAALMQNPSGKKRASGEEMTDGHALALTLAAGPDSVVTFPGGVPIRANGQVVGGIGVSGTKDELCQEVAETAIRALEI